MVFCDNLQMQKQQQQECIPVGYVPSATVAVCQGGAWSGGVSAPGGCLVWGCLLWGVPCLGVPAPGGTWSGGSAPGMGSGIPACIEADPPANRMTDRCINITFASSLRTVTKQIN